MVVRGERLLKREDRLAAEVIMDSLRADGVDLRLAHQAQRFVCEGHKQWLECRNKVDGSDVVLPFDRVLLALGRRANVSGFGLETLSLKFGTTVRLKPMTFWPPVFRISLQSETSLVRISSPTRLHIRRGMPR